MGVLGFVLLIGLAVMQSVDLAFTTSTALKHDEDGTLCDDGNVCTENYQIHDGACTFLPSNNEKECESACFNDSGITTFCDGTGLCTGLSCNGACVDTGDCIDIFGDGRFACTAGGTCMYTLQVASPQTFAVEGDLAKDVCLGPISAKWFPCLDISTFVIDTADDSLTRNVKSLTNGDTQDDTGNSISDNQMRGKFRLISTSKADDRNKKYLPKVRNEYDDYEYEDSNRGRRSNSRDYNDHESRSSKRRGRDHDRIQSIETYMDEIDSVQNDLSSAAQHFWCTYEFACASYSIVIPTDVLN